MYKRRDSLKKLSALGAVVTTLPTTWVSPIVNSVVLPSHAATSNELVFRNDNFGPEFQVTAVYFRINMDQSVNLSVEASCTTDSFTTKTRYCAGYLSRLLGDDQIEDVTVDYSNNTIVRFTNIRMVGSNKITATYFFGFPEVIPDPGRQGDAVPEFDSTGQIELTRGGSFPVSERCINC